MLQGRVIKNHIESLEEISGQVLFQIQEYFVVKSLEPSIFTPIVRDGITGGASKILPIAPALLIDISPPADVCHISMKQMRKLLEFTIGPDARLSMNPVDENSHFPLNPLIPNSQNTF